MYKAKYFLYLIFIISSAAHTYAQNIEGTWVGGVNGLPLVLEFSHDDNGLTAKMQSPKQSKSFMNADVAIMKGDSVFIELNQFQIKYKGLVQGELINGTFSQATASLPMIFEKKAYQEVIKKRPQLPKKPYPYQVEEVSFVNDKANGIRLSGTLTLPPGVSNPPVAILISGSGPQDRDETILEHKPFLVLAHHLTKNGIAVLRYDDRGVGKSQGNHSTATTADFATDAAAAVNYLASRSDINKKQIGLIGHSEGGLIAPMVIAAHPKKVAFFVSLAGTGVKGSEVLVTQIKRKSELDGYSQEDVLWEEQLMIKLFKEVEQQTDLSQNDLEQQLHSIITTHAKSATASQKAKYPESIHNTLAKQFSNTWMRFFITHDPQNDIAKVSVPSLLMNGTLDYQVIPHVNMDPMSKTMVENGNRDVTVLGLEGLNHLFQTAKTGNANEYEAIEETFAPIALNAVSKWINARF